MTANGSSSLSATESTGPIAYNAPASGPGSLQESLEGLAAIGSGTIDVNGGPGGPKAENPYIVSFDHGSLANVNVSQMTANSSLLTGGENHIAVVTTTIPGGPGTTELGIYVQNIGGFRSSGTTTVRFTLPSGITTERTPETGFSFQAWHCLPEGAGQTTVTCTTTSLAPPGIALSPLRAPVVAGPGAATGVVHITVEGGGTVGTVEHNMPLVVSALPALPGVQDLVAGAYDSNGVPDVRAGGHPYSASAGILVTTKRSGLGLIQPVGEFKDIIVSLPTGFLGNPISTAQCPDLPHCPADTTVATVQIPLRGLQQGEVSPVYDMAAPYGYPAKFRFLTGLKNVVINVTGSLRSDKDYGIDVGSYDTPQIIPVMGSFFTFWGTPGDVSHDEQRCAFFINPESPGGECGPGAGNVAFLTNATNCAEQAATQPVTTLNTNSWQHPELFFTQDFPVPAVTECDKLKFESNFTFEPSDTKSDSPASFRSELTVPEEGLTNPTKLTTPEIKKTVVKLPKGVVLNASGADGLSACSEQQIGLANEIDPTTGLPKPLPMPLPIRFNREPNHCPDSSKIGSGELKSALIEEPLHGALYLAAQGKGNPFGSLFAIYLVIEDPRHGVFVKVPGEIEADKQTGQLEVTFDNTPQLPFTYLRLSLKGGNRSALASPNTCGNFVTTATSTPWSAPESGPPTESSNGFEINQGPNGLPCAKTPQERPFDIGWKAGAQSTQAGASSPFSFQITRPDGSQEIDTLSLTTPPGLSASLKGVPYCSEAQIKQVEARTGKQELANPACPGASQVGSLEVGSGSGPTPFYTGGKLYLAGPYKGAPISVVSVTPAVAGPFDLGNVVSRNALFINRQTAQVTAKSDPIPQLLDGVVLRIRDVRIFLNHKDWTLNPTSCDASSANLTIHGNSGATAERSARFQVGGCDKLNFAPKLTAKVTGGTQRGDHPAFTAELNYPPGGGYANIRDVQVALPHSEFLDQSHINTICTRVQAAANACPAGSIYGYAEATTPLLDGKLTGPVFLKSSDHQLPDLAIALKGPENQPIEVEFAGRIDSVHAQIRNTIEGLPDVAVSKFVLKMKGGKKGLLVNSRNLCQGKPGRMTVNMTAQNSKTADSRPVLGNSCGKAKKHKKAKKHHKRHQLSRLVAGW